MRNQVSGDLTLFAEVSKSFEARTNIVQVKVNQSSRDPAALEADAAPTWTTSLGCEITRSDETPIT